MAFTVAILGGLIVAGSLVGLVDPSTLSRIARAWRTPTMLYLAATIRLVLGVFLFLAAPSCRFPLLVQGFGGIAIAAALMIPLMGVRRAQALLDWWAGGSATFIRLWLLVGAVVGVVVVFAAV